MAKEQAAAVIELTPEQIERRRMEEYRKESAERKARRDANYKSAVECCDPAVASRVVNSRPTFRYQCEYVHVRDGKRVKYEGEVVAQNESDAWAIFCDLNPKMNHPSPKHPGRKITLLGPSQFSV